MKSNRSRIAGVFRFLGSIVLLGILLYRFNWREIWMLWQQANWGWALLAALLFLIRLGLTGFRWSQILFDLGVRERWTRLALINTFSLFWGNFLPTTLGGDGYRFLALRQKQGISQAVVASSILADRLYGGFGLLLAHVVTASLYVFLWLQNPYLRIGEGVILIGTIVLGILWVGPRQIDRMYERIRANLPRPLVVVFDALRRIFLLLGEQKTKTIWMAVLISAFFNALIALEMWIFFVTLGSCLDFGQVLYSTTLANLVGMLPISINGLGSMEAVYVLSLQTVASKEAIILASLLARFLRFAISVAGGGIYAVQGLLRETDEPTF